MFDVAFDRVAIRARLDDLAAELARRGARADLFLVGDAATAVAYDARRATGDLDAVFQPTDAVLATADRYGLTEDQLNGAVKGFMHGPDTDTQRYYAGEALTVDVASARFPCWAMKLFASRVESDADDIAFLNREVGFTTVEEGLDLVANACPARPVPAKGSSY